MFNYIVGVVTLFPNEESTTYVNGAELHQPMRLTTGSRIILGNNHVFRFINPVEGKGSTHEMSGRGRDVIAWCFSSPMQHVTKHVQRELRLLR